MRDVKDIPPKEFSKLFFEAVEEFYDEWVEDTGAQMPVFKAALDHAKKVGVLPNE
tara:strand:- start:4926 stop:5090 length:165 start_codon:yes stop_codon:yes gene_type:complete